MQPIQASSSYGRVDNSCQRILGGHPVPPQETTNPHLAVGHCVYWIDLHQGSEGLQEEVAYVLANDHVSNIADGRPKLLTQLTILRRVQPAPQGLLDMSLTRPLPSTLSLAGNQLHTPAQSPQTGPFRAG